MFAVPGWNLTASKPVREKPSSSKSQKSSTITKKRKRSSQNDEQVESINEFETWQEIESGSQAATRSKVTKHQQGPERQNRAFAAEDATSDVFPRTQQEQPQQKRKPDSQDHRTEKHVRTKKRNGETTRHQTHNGQQTNTTTSLPPPPPPSSNPTPLTPLQQKMRNKLTSARFRHLNETLYTTPSSTALTLFRDTPSLFAEYHAGFSQQVTTSWPTNPVDTFIQAIRIRAPLSTTTSSNDKITPLPRRKTSSCTITDLGSGDAPLARAFVTNPALIKKWSLRFHSYDLHAANAHVTVADIAHLPLRDGEADIAIFCLSLMGTNWLEFVEEAWRVLRGDGKGECWVAEVKSRFGRVGGGRRGRVVVENSVGKKRKRAVMKGKQQGEDEQDGGPEGFAEAVDDGVDADETDVSEFVKVFERRGFMLKKGSVDKSNKMFVSMIFYKSGVPSTGKHKGKKWNGKEYQQGGKEDGRMKFIDRGKPDDDIASEDEARVLKPCVYKIR